MNTTDETKKQKEDIIDFEMGNIIHEALYEYYGKDLKRADKEYDCLKYAIKKDLELKNKEIIEKLEEIKVWPVPQPGAGQEIGALFGAGMYTQYDADKKKHEEQIVEVINLIKEEKEHVPVGRCNKCNKELVPDLEAKNFATGEWDEHSYKYSCECNDKDLRVMIG